MENTVKKKGFMDKVTDFIIDKLAGPMGKFASFKTMQVIKDGLVAVMPVVLVGSLFLLIALLGQPVIGNTGKPLIPALAPFYQNIGLVQSLTMGFMSLYASIAFSVCYARVYKLDELTMSVLGLSAFLLININKITEGTIPVSNFGSMGMFIAMISTFLSGWIYKTCIKKNFIIKMPEGVPQGIGNAFSALIPFTIVFIITWIIRTVMNIDLAVVLTNLLKPVLSGADNIGIFTLRVFIAMAFWSVGIHGDNMVGAVTGPLLLMYVGENSKAAMSGIPLTMLPHIWTEGLERCVMYTSAMWGLMFWMFFSKRKSTRTLAIGSAPSAIFCIIEPIVYGLPVVMNPILIIPWILSATISAFLGYGFVALHLCNRFFIALPWATPSPIQAFLGTGGDWRAIILCVIAFVVGIVVYYPFFKVMEKQNAIEDEKEKAKVA